MGDDKKVLDFSQHFRPSARYRELLGELASRLEETSGSYSETAFNLAISGKWKEWEASKPVGSVVNLSEDMMMGTGDEFVEGAINLSVAMTDLAEKIRARLKRSSIEAEDDA